MNQLELNIGAPESGPELEVVNRVELEGMSEATVMEIYKNDFGVSPDVTLSKNDIIEAIMNPERETLRLQNIRREEDEEDRKQLYKR